MAVGLHACLHNDSNGGYLSWGCQGRARADWRALPAGMYPPLTQAGMACTLPTQQYRNWARRFAELVQVRRIHVANGRIGEQVR
jgi:hypothetical protein